MQGLRSPRFTHGVLAHCLRTIFTPDVKDVVRPPQRAGENQIRGVRLPGVETKRLRELFGGAEVSSDLAHRDCTKEGARAEVADGRKSNSWATFTFRYAS